MALLLETLYGDLVIDLDVEGSPELCKNIIKLAYCRYYTNTLIFNVTAQRFCQLGCPIGDGTGGACIYGLIDTVRKQQQNANFDYKLSKYRFLKSIGRTLTPLECQEKGRVVATLMNFTPDTIGSQFLITTTGGTDHALDGYTQNTGGNAAAAAAATTDNSISGRPQQFLSLGKVVEDEHNVLDKINAAYTDPNGRPYADIRIIRALVIYDPFVNEVIPGNDLLLKSRGVIVDDEIPPNSTGSIIIDSTNRRVIDSPSPDRPAEESVSKRISAADIALDGDNEDIYMDDDKYEQERIRQRRMDEEETAKKVDHSRAVVLEMIGDLPDANIRAPENVLFICKLNPITIDEDLELIFSRFDEKVKVEIIRDIDTGSSLQYAFAEFTTEKAAAEAYFKMNNALIDDRRIKVDFSQSVAKLWDRYHQKMKMPTYHHQKSQRSGNENNDMKRTTGKQNESKRHSSGQSNKVVRLERNDSGRGHESNNHSYRRNENGDNRTTYRSDDAIHNNLDRNVDERMRDESNSRNRNRNDDDDRRHKRERSRHKGHFDKYDDRGRSYAEHSNESYRRSHRSDDVNPHEESDGESRHDHSRLKKRHKHDQNRRKNQDDDSVDTVEGKQRRHSKKSHRSRDDDVEESDHHHHRHHKHKKKRERESDRDGRSSKHRRRSRSESR